MTVTGTSNRTYELDVTRHVRDAKAAGRNTITLVLRGTSNTSPYAIFKSDDEASDRPELVVVPG